jgi:hypothetical protein
MRIIVPNDPVADTDLYLSIYYKVREDTMKMCLLNLQRVLKHRRLWSSINFNLEFKTLYLYMGRRTGATYWAVDKIYQWSIEYNKKVYYFNISSDMCAKVKHQLAARKSFKQWNLVKLYTYNVSAAKKIKDPGLIICDTSLYVKSCLDAFTKELYRHSPDLFIFL